MTGSASPSTAIFSIFTVAILRDTNWYAEVGDNLTEKLAFGKNKGCSFLEGTCNDLK